MARKRGRSSHEETRDLERTGQPEGVSAKRDSKMADETERKSDQPADVGDATGAPGAGAPSHPVATREYVVTVDTTTWVPTKIETLDSATGERKELPAEEYAAAMAYFGFTQPAAALSAADYASAITPIVESYWKGYTDYLKALTSAK